MKGQTPNRRFTTDNSIPDSLAKSQNDIQRNNQISTNQGYTEFFSWGNDEMGQLGHGQESADRKKIFNLPKSLSFEVLISQVSCGYSHTSFISKQGYVFSFGCNSDGQLGVNDPTIKFSTAPLLVSDLVSLQTTPIQISCGGHHTAVLTSVGDVYLWGRNLQGQCGRSINYNQFMFAPHKLHADSANKLFRSIDCGDQHTAVISNTGELFTFGDNSEGQLGIGIEYKSNIDRPALVTGISEETLQVSCGYRHTLVLTNHGTVFGMGTNKKYELASGTLQKASQPIRIQTIDMFNVQKVIAGGFSVALTNNNELLVWGSGDFGTFQSPQKVYMEDVQFVDVSLSKTYDSFGVAVDSQGLIYTWGQNQFGQLGQGDFRMRKLPTKVPQLRKKKVREVIAGGCFVVALGKDVPEGAKQGKAKKAQQMTNEHDQQNSGRSKSQVTFGNSSIGQSVKRKKHDLDKSHMTTLNDMNQRSSLKGAERYTNHSQEKRPSPLRVHNKVNVYQTPNLRNNTNTVQIEQQYPQPTQNEFSIERQRRIQVERELREKDYELMNQKQQGATIQDLQAQINMYQRDNEVLREALQKEQENSYRLLSDVHKSLSDMKNIKETLEIKSKETHQLSLENRRLTEIIREFEMENDKLKQNASHILLRNDEEAHKFKSHIAECELIINQQRDHIKDLERQIHTKIDHQKQIDNETDQVRKENQDLRIQVFSLNEKIKSLEYQVDSSQKENDDLKYDNTILYEKNVQKDDKLVQLNDELMKARNKIEEEINRGYQSDQEKQYLHSKIKELEDKLHNDQLSQQSRQRQYEDMIKELERQKRQLDDDISLKNVDYDNLKRAFDEQHYEMENQRKTLNAKQEEISSLNKIIQQQSTNNNELVGTIKELENTIKDVEDKNKRLVELLNANIYNKAEQYKERVLNKLQERTPGSVITPNKTAGGYTNPNYNLNTEVTDFKNPDQPPRAQPSPIRLQKLLNDDQNQIHKERERLLKMAEDMTKNHDLSRSQGHPSTTIQSNNPLNDYQNFRQNLPQFVSPFSKNDLSTISPSKSVHFADQQQRDNNPNGENNARLRMSDFSGGFVNMATPYQQQQLQNQSNSRGQHENSSPDRIAEILKQQSPLRKKLATDSLMNRGMSDNVTPNKPNNHRMNDSNFDDSELQVNQSTGNFTASKITHKLLSSQLEELKQQMQQQQQEKLDLQQRLKEYESNQSRH